jgi:hypothetical protein
MLAAVTNPKLKEVSTAVRNQWFTSVSVMDFPETTLHRKVESQRWHDVALGVSGEN